MMSIMAVNLMALDLNLLRTLDALLDEQSVTRAGKRLGLTQPAVSNALGRLRGTLGDELLVRSGSVMRLTPRAEEIAPKLRSALVALGDSVAQPAPFHAKTATDRFSIAATDYFEMVLLPAIVARVHAAAPQVELDVRPIGDTSPIDDMNQGKLDGALGVFPNLPPGFRQKVLGRERFVCVVRRGHPLMSGKKLTLAKYAELAHLLVAPRRSGPGAVDNALAKVGLSRHIALRVSHFLVAPLVIAETDLVATLPERAALLLQKQLKLDMFPPPVELGGFPLMYVWPERTHGSAPHRFLREAICGHAA
jgi:DNA-binding transcriptional LysR family regulator